MSAKYYTHFIAQSEDAIEYNEYRGVVELLGQAMCCECTENIAVPDNESANGGPA